MNVRVQVYIYFTMPFSAVIVFFNTVFQESQMAPNAGMPLNQNDLVRDYNRAKGNPNLLIKVIVLS